MRYSAFSVAVGDAVGCVLVGAGSTEGEVESDLLSCRQYGTLRVQPSDGFTSHVWSRVQHLSPRQVQ